MNENWKEWLDNKIYLLSTPMGAGVGITSFIVGMLIGKIILDAMKGL